MFTIYTSGLNSFSTTEIDAISFDDAEAQGFALADERGEQLWMIDSGTRLVGY